MSFSSSTGGSNMSPCQLNICFGVFCDILYSFYFASNNFCLSWRSNKHCAAVPHPSEAAHEVDCITTTWLVCPILKAPLYLPFLSGAMQWHQAVLFMQPKARFRLRNIFLCHEGHHVRLKSDSGISSCHVVVRRLATLTQHKHHPDQSVITTDRNLLHVQRPSGRCGKKLSVMATVALMVAVFCSDMKKKRKKNVWKIAEPFLGLVKKTVQLFALQRECEVC